MTDIGAHILGWLTARDSSQPLSREDIQDMLGGLGIKIHVRDVQVEVNSLNVELKEQGRLIVSGPGRRGYWIPKACERDYELLEHAERTFDAHADAARERAKEIRNHRADLEARAKQPVYDRTGQAVMFPCV